MLKHGLYI